VAGEPSGSVPGFGRSRRPVRRRRSGHLRRHHDSRRCRSPGIRLAAERSKRHPDAADKRAELLYLSDRGRDMLDTVREFHAEYERRPVARVGADQVATVRAVLGEIVGAAADSDAVRPLRGQPFDSRKAIYPSDSAPRLHG
jgi:hypothetical protein